MGNCFNLQLKGSAENDNLPILNTIKLGFNYPNDGNSHGNILKLQFSKATTISLVSDDGATFVGGGTSVDIPANTLYTNEISYGSGYILIPNKDSIVRFEPGGTASSTYLNSIFSMDVMEINMCEELTRAILQFNTGCYGLIDDLIVPSITALYLELTSVSGSITSMIENIYNNGYNYSDSTPQQVIVNGSFTYTNGDEEILYVGNGVNVYLKNKKYEVRKYSDNTLLVARIYSNGVWHNDSSVLS